MADIKVDSYEEDFNYPKFTEDMVKTHTILIPSMLPIHMALFESLLCQTGYKVEIMKNEGPDVVTEGLKYVHNDTCYPALLVIGQFIDNLNHRNDHDKLVLLITQTGGGCRASNYLHLLRKALKKAGYGFIPVVSLNASNLEKDSGFKITLPLVLNLSSAITYADELMYLRNKCQTYEINKGETARLVDKWIKELSDQYAQGKGRKYGQMKKNLIQMVKEFDAIPLDLSHKKPKVGIVGEIYIKYASLGNNHLEDFLVSQGAEVMVPGLFGFILYSLYNGIYDNLIYGRSKKTALLNKALIWYIRRREKLMIESIGKTKITPMKYFSHTKDLSDGVLDHGVK
ncbi:MAG: 2-hydroxyacyl-CoA dehydratase, partial [Acholeplasmatales bacterium]|nr:2-hydroxyacyl-CoA dehydratase [Acholeplasmatales bacterium]